ncbi:hypothetical protein ACFLSE_08385 [Bacteroidota bacterium]
MIKRLFIIVCAFLGFSCESDKSNDMTSKIEKKLEYALNKFESKNNAFVVSIFHNDTCLVQIVHRSYIEKTRQQFDTFGFALNLSFDTTSQQETEYLEKFKQLDISKKFAPYDWDGIPCYAIDFAIDTKSAAKITALILKDLYGLDESSNLKIEVVNQGKL